MDSMLSKVLREFTTGPLNQLLVNLGGRDGHEWEEEFLHFLRKEPCWAAVQPQSLLALVGTSVTLGPATNRLVVKEKFVVNTGPSASVQISYVGETFRNWFFRKVELPMTITVLHSYALKQRSVDRPIIAALGGEDKAETTLAEVYAMMLRQPNGKKGSLLTNGYANIFYVRDASGVLYAVRVRWRGDGWGVNAESVEDQDAWSDGDQVFSHNSLVLDR